MSNNSTSGARSALNPTVLLNDLLTAWRLLWSPRVPLGLKLMLPVLAMVYWVFPLDLMPGLPFDDIALLVLAIKLFLQLAPSDAVNNSANYSANSQARSTGTHEDDGAIDTTWRVVRDE